MSVKCSYKLRVNIAEFKLDVVKVSIENLTKNINDRSFKVKISATKSETKDFLESQKKSEESFKKYIKYYDVSGKSLAVSETMRHYLDQNNSNYLIIEFDSDYEENVFINLDDSCESLVEMAAKSLLNIKDIETIRHSIENPFDSNPNTNKTLAEVFSTSIIKDLNSATTTSLTPVQKSISKEGDRIVKININIPSRITSASLLNKNSKSILKENKFNVIDLCDETVTKNHLFIRFEGMIMYLEANTTQDEISSFFSKQIKVPKGSITNDLVYKLDHIKNVIRIEFPYFGL